MKELATRKKIAFFLVAIACVVSCTCAANKKPIEELSKYDELREIKDHRPNIIYGQNYSPDETKRIIQEGNLDDLDRFIRAMSFQTKDNERGFADFNNYMFGIVPNLNKSELRYIRNTIYARHGYIFNSVDLRNHFSRFSWYLGTKINVDNELNEFEIITVNILRQVENNYLDNASKEIVGYWFADIPEDDWWAYDIHDVYLRHHGNLYDKGTLQFWQNGMFLYNFIDFSDEKTNVYYYFGFWSYSDEKLNLIFSFCGINDEYSVFDPDRHHVYNIVNFKKDINFYNKNINIYGIEVWECYFQNNLPPWKKVLDDPYLVMSFK